MLTGGNPDIVEVIVNPVSWVARILVDFHALCFKLRPAPRVYQLRHQQPGDY
ncbi:MAG: hypothetical protein H0T45_01000 [Pyrinomonadaceae bacterium]|nr:hypothetical protein [Pyrinomonadaceae bacterium]